jgi:tight adherence protein C
MSDLNLGIGPFTFGLIEALLLVCALATAAFSIGGLYRQTNRESRQKRVEALRGQVLHSDAEPKSRRRSNWLPALGGMVVGSPLVGSVETSKLTAALAAAGFRGPGRLTSFMAIKLLGLTLAPILVWALLRWRGIFADQMIPQVTIVLGALICGWRLPDGILERLAKRRKARLELGMPDAMDLLLICVEAGLGLEQAVEQIGRDLVSANRDVAEEFSTTAAEMRVLGDRRLALENLATRTGLDSLRGMVAMLAQSLRFGTPLSESLRILATEMRGVRIARFEEQGAKLPVLLTLPMMAFIMPCLFLIIVGPTALHLIDSFQ